MTSRPKPQGHTRHKSQMMTSRPKPQGHTHHKSQMMASRPRPQGHTHHKSQMIASRPKTSGRQRVGPLTTSTVSSSVGIGSVVVRVEPSRAASQACVVVAIPFRVNHWVLQALHAGTASALHNSTLFDQSVMAFAAYKAVEDKLSGSTADAIKNRVVGSTCGVQGNEFLISVTCAPTLTSARKCAGIIIQNLRWGFLYQQYMNWCKALGVRADKAAYSHAAEIANRVTHQGITVVITGKVQADDAGVARTADLLSRKIKDSGPKEEGRSRTVGLNDIKHADGATVDSLYVSYPAPSLFGVIAYNFIESNIRGKASQLVSGVLYVPKSKNSQVKRLDRADKVNKYATSLLRLGSEARSALVFIAARGCYVASADLTIGGPTLTEANIMTAIQHTFK